MRIRASLFYLAVAPVLFGAPPAVTSLDASFRYGQTFVTWRQPVTAGVQYRIYRSGAAIAVVHDQSSLNLMASIDRLKLSNTRAPAEYEIPTRVYFTIRDGGAPLTPESGLFVYTAKTNEEAEYRVAAVVEGVEGPLSPAARVRESVDFPRPVRQSELDFVHWTDNVGTAMYPAMSSVPGVAYNFRLRTPSGPGPHPMIGFLHGGYLQYLSANMGASAEESAVRIAFDSPLMRGKIKDYPQQEWPAGAWYGYNENFGTGKPLDQGKTADYVVRRILWTFDWAERFHRIDSDRVSIRGGSMGGIGAVLIGLLHPSRFAAIHAFIPPLRMRQAGFMMPIVPADYVTANSQVELPYILYTAGRTDQVVGWPDKLEFAEALRKVKAGFTFYWDMRGHDQRYTGPVPANLSEPPVPWGRTPERPELPLTAFSRKMSFPAITDLTVDSDPGTVNFAVPPNARPPLDSKGAGDWVGTYNGAVAWKNIVDEPGRWEISLELMPFAKSDTATATITPRRTQQFRLRAGDSVGWRVSDSEGTAGEGQVTADTRGVATVSGIRITKRGTRLILWTKFLR